MLEEAQEKDFRYVREYQYLYIRVRTVYLKNADYLNNCMKIITIVLHWEDKRDAKLML